MNYLPLVFGAAFVCLVGAPIAQILARMGFSRWWCVAAFWPGVNLIMLWILANRRWPAVDGPVTILESLKRRS
jgi:hypothetical protein